MELLLIRHGESTANSSRLTAGRLDVPLTANGREQARELGMHLPQIMAGKKIVRVISSPLARAIDTAALLQLPLQADMDSRWMEMDYGDFDGLPIDSVPAGFWQRWMADIGYAPPGGESLVSVGTRVRSACHDIVSQGYKDDEIVVVVSHVSPIKAAIAWSLGAGDQAAWHMHLDTASVSSVSILDGKPLMHRFNQHYH
ncbi:MAG: histidine phosphatase family protein [Actinobacteria bacterium]|jgi:broad specificity phosphatase PhoE|nr:histidine phosphatase family protein [Actinomycetota bacterium]